MRKAGLCVLLAGVVLAGPAPARNATALQVSQDATLGAYLADDNGRAVYMFKKDTQGKNGSPPVTTCSGGCATDWPPVLAEQPIQAGDSSVKASMLGTITRNDGKTQVTYNGWPLYYYYMDNGPGGLNGQDRYEYGAEWYLLRPDGEIIRSAREG